VALGVVFSRVGHVGPNAHGAGLESPPASATAHGSVAPDGTGAAVAPGPQAIDPALFSPGACMAFPPTNGDRGETVFLDAGHGGLDPGGVGKTKSGASVEESTVNLAIELDTMALLRRQGYRVAVSRTRDTTVTRLTPADVKGGLFTVLGAHNEVAARDVCANKAKADVLVGIYMDSGEPQNAGSVTAYDQARPFSGDNLRLATQLQSDVLGAMNAQGWEIPNEGVQSDTGLGSAISSKARAYGHLLLLGPAKSGFFETPSQMPGALIEPLFVTDPFEASIAASAHWQQVIARAMAGAIEQYLTRS
jgi:N-acetylmuramoyl-L-alanine amidase